MIVTYVKTAFCLTTLEVVHYYFTVHVPNLWFTFFSDYTASCCDYWGNPCRSFIPGFH